MGSGLSSCLGWVCTLNAVDHGGEPRRKRAKTTMRRTMVVPSSSCSFLRLGAVHDAIDPYLTNKDMNRLMETNRFFLHAYGKKVQALTLHFRYEAFSSPTSIHSTGKQTKPMLPPATTNNTCIDIFCSTCLSLCLFRSPDRVIFPAAAACPPASLSARLYVHRRPGHLSAEGRLQPA